ncbi:MAG: site-specific integrase [Chitinophagaceae bacterium]
MATGVFIYAKPKTQVEKNHNKEAQLILEAKRSQYILENQATGSGLIPSHKFKANFMDYFSEYVTMNKRFGNRSLECSFKYFVKFVAKDHISPIDITETFCQRFRQFLMDTLTSETPANYFARFKKVLKAATKDGYYRISPAEDVKSKKGKPGKLKENLEAEEYIKLLKTPCFNTEVREAFIFSCYTALRWCDVKKLKWSDISGNQLKTQIVQSKTGKRLSISLHPIAKEILEKRRGVSTVEKAEINVFKLPSHNAAIVLLDQWCRNARIRKHITWHCARLSFSILLQDAKVDNATVALLLGHTTTKYVDEIYKRHRPKDQICSISRLPMPDKYIMN